jgi:putative two-component system response regulator
MSHPRVLVVDDTPKNIQLLASVLKANGYEVGFAVDGYKALEALQRERYDLVLLDVMMPGMDGFTVCRKIKEDPALQPIPVIFTTALNDTESIVKGFEVGGADYITKPFNTVELLARVRSQIQLKRLQDKEIEATQREIIFTMGAIAETRSQETGNHVRRVAEYSYLLAKLHGMSDEDAERLQMASPMHDIGKVGIPDSILNKPGKLTAEEWETMKTHSQLGYEMLRHSQRPILKTAALVALEHHEKWNGTGYPRGLRGEEISLEGRITALADVFDALGSDRCYKKAWELDRILDLFREERGQHFDPTLTDLFFEHLDRFLELRERFPDPTVTD